VTFIPKLVILMDLHKIFDKGAIIAYVEGNLYNKKSSSK